MIEKFSKEEIAQILKELGIEKQPVPKKSVVLAEQKVRIARMFCKKNYPETNELRRNGSSCGIDGRSARDDIFNAVVTLIDYTFENFTMGVDTFRQPAYRRSTTIKDGDAEKYKAMFDEILDVIEKHHN